MDKGLKSILDKVQKPGRYTGGETNSIRKAFSSDRVSLALAYPDAYEVGMSYLGLKILYHLLNERDDVVCERVFAPWPDMEKELLGAGRKLFSLESKRDINSFDIVGFSLSYELTYTNVINMLHLSGISIRSEERNDEEPLVIAGGACCANPEPMSEFIDVFFVGDSEETLPVFIDKFRELKKRSMNRKAMLKEFSFLPGLYVPALYKSGYEGGKFAGLIAEDGEVPISVQRAVIPDLDKAYYPVKQIVPFIKTVHDRIAVEIMRGCPNRCRFCQAGIINRPVRLRKPDTVREICRSTYDKTGYEQISLLSLSSVDYPYLVELVEGMNSDFGKEGVGISIPSLRVDEAFYKLPEMISVIRKAGLTFAPESAGDDIRRAIGKDIDLGVLCRSAELAYQNGWKRIKLYFMIGFPAADESSRDIVSLARNVSNARRAISKRSAEVKVSINPFVPKPHTPFQWLGMQTRQRLQSEKEYLLSRSSKRIQIEVHDINKSILEGCLSRGDRRVGKVIYSAWERGARMDSWTDFFDYSIWRDSFNTVGLDPERMAALSYSFRDPLPWGHIDTGISGKYLKNELIESGFLTDPLT